MPWCAVYLELAIVVTQTALGVAFRKCGIYKGNYK